MADYAADEWAGATDRRPRAGVCLTCGAGPERQWLYNAKTFPMWRCTSCHTTTDMVLPFDPSRAPEGRTEGHLAIDTLAILVPTFAPIDRETIYLILRAYFARGWCVQDVIRAMDYRPSGESHRGGGIAWVRGEPSDKVLARLRDRLWTWRWRDEGNPNNDDIMDGYYTGMRAAMARNREEQEIRHHDQARAAAAQREAAAAGRELGVGMAMARRVALVATSQARQLRVIAQRREAEHMAAEFARGKAAAEAWRKLIDDEPPDDTAS